MIKDDQEGTKNPYKCMNVMKQDAMDDKIKEICKTCEKQCMQKDLDRSRGVEDLAVDRYRCRASVEVQKHQTQEIWLDQSTKCQEAIEGTGTFSIDPPGVEEVSS